MSELKLGLQVANKLFNPDNYHRETPKNKSFAIFFSLRVNQALVTLVMNPMPNI